MKIDDNFDNIAFPKPKREQDKKYLGWIQTYPSCLMKCHFIVTTYISLCAGQIVAHHVSTGGMGTKCSDYETVPLCNEHHREIHDKGKRIFQAKYGIDLKEEAERLRREYEGR